jgi:DMSO/TMAO reductase YedYZ molybdopterin-dependent catalytic subunit
MTAATPLPRGQVAMAEFPCFGLPRFADRLPREVGDVRLEISGDVESPMAVTRALSDLARVDLIADFHCVTTWSVRALRWSGYRFADFYRLIVVPEARPTPAAALVVLHCRDGYRTGLPLTDLCADDVLLADRLNGEPLTLAHGAPLRLIAPAHYGYKCAKYLRVVEFRPAASRYRTAALGFMDHPRARVAFEERGRGVPGWLLRHLYRPLIDPTIRRFRRALDRRGREG